MESRLDFFSPQAYSVESSKKTKRTEKWYNPDKKENKDQSPNAS
jgi:hypothetical protein